MKNDSGNSAGANIALAGLAVLLAVLLSEILVRLLGISYPRVMDYDPLLGG